MPRGRQRVVLAALLLRAGKPVAADALADLVPDRSPPPGAAVTLRSHVLRLRRALGPRRARLVTCHPGYLLQAGDDELDVLHFGELCGQARPTAREGAWPRAAGLLEEALGLWRDTLLADVPSELLRQRELASLGRQHMQSPRRPDATGTA